jgi:hypothetical protein
MMMLMLVGRDKESGEMLIMSNDGSKSDSGNDVFG